MFSEQDKADAIVVLDGAKDVLDRYGWHQGLFGDEEKGYCLVGAARKAAEELGLGSGFVFTTPLYFSLVQEAMSRGFSAPTIFNDFGAKNVFEIEDFIDCTIDRLKEESNA